MAQPQLQNAQNFLVPALGTTRIYTVRQTLVAGEPHEVDFRAIGLDGRPFIPYSAMIDNSLGTADLVISVLDIGYRFFCPAGGATQQMYPAPLNQRVTIEGEGDVVVVFADYPVMPISSQVDMSSLLQTLIDQGTVMATAIANLSTAVNNIATSNGEIAVDTAAIRVSTNSIDIKMNTANSLLADIKANTTPAP